MMTVERPVAGPDPQDLAERRRAARALLLTPLLRAAGPQGEEFVLVRRHQGELTRLFAEGLGYRLQVDPAAARLFKAGLGRDPSRPLRRRSGVPFTPRAYALLCLTVAALTRSRAQLLVDELVAQVRSAAVDAGLTIDLDAAADRRALHAALMVLVGLGVLHERDGDLEHWADQRTQSLLDVRRDLLTLLVSAPLASAEGPDALLELAAVPSAAGGARSALRRRLLESPVLSTADLTPDQAEWWRRNRNREREWYAERFGLELELRAEGAVAIDPDDELGDELFPGRDKTRQLALLVLERLVAEVRDRPRYRAIAAAAGLDHDQAIAAAAGLEHDRAAGAAGPDHGKASGAEGAPVTPSPWSALPVEQAHRLGLEVVAGLGERLRRDQREQPAGAVADALAVLERFGLLRIDAASVSVHAAGARYAPRLTLDEAATTGERSLFETQEEGDR